MNYNCIRMVHLKEQEFIYDAMQRLANEFYCGTIDKDRFSKKIAENGEFIAAFIDNTLVGFIGYYANDNVTKKAYITTIVISSSFRKRGIGKALIHACLSECYERGMKSCWLEVNKFNTNAAGFYSHIGFEKCGRASEKSDYYTIMI